MIVAAAIRLANGSVFVGKRHGDCFRNAVFIHNIASPDYFPQGDVDQGFINDRLEFLDRKQAYHEAFRCGQCKEQKETSPNLAFQNLAFPDLKWKPRLFSEDLW